LPKKSKLRIRGVDRALMFLCKDLRRRCFQYRPEVAQIRKLGVCAVCTDHSIHRDIEADHIEPVGSRPHFIEDFPEYYKRMMFLPMQGLCPKHHKDKTAKARKDKRDEKEALKQSL
jgi:hypothetical protein